MKRITLQRWCKHNQTKTVCKGDEVSMYDTQSNRLKCNFKFVHIFRTIKRSEFVDEKHFLFYKFAKDNFDLGPKSQSRG